MFKIRLTLSKKSREQLKNELIKAEKAGNIKLLKRILAILFVLDGDDVKVIASRLLISSESIRIWLIKYVLYGINGLYLKKYSGRPPKLTKNQRKKIGEIIDKGPLEAGFTANCWRSPMIQHLIYDKYGVFYSVHYISQLLKNMGFSFQKAKFVSDHHDPEKRREWIENTWPEILRVAKEKDACILFGDEASFPQWGTLTYTWSRKGKQPVVKTSGNRKGYKVLGLIDYYTGDFFCKGHEGRLNSESYANFLKETLSQTNKHVILIQDGASYHRSKAMKEFFKQNSDQITVYQLPSYSPDYNPIEKLWKKVKTKETHLHYFPTFDSLKVKVEKALLNFKNLQEEILSLFGFYRKLEVASSS